MPDHGVDPRRHDPVCPVGLRHFQGDLGDASDAEPAPGGQEGYRQDSVDWGEMEVCTEYFYSSGDGGKKAEAGLRGEPDSDGEQEETPSRDETQSHPYLSTFFPPETFMEHLVLDGPEVEGDDADEAYYGEGELG